MSARMLSTRIKMTFDGRAEMGGAACGASAEALEGMAALAPGAAAGAAATGARETGAFLAGSVQAMLAPRASRVNAARFEKVREANAFALEAFSSGSRLEARSARVLRGRF
jgi:hypothetical protein